MILTVTLNPSVDIAYHLDQLNLDTTNRVAESFKTPGGKGLNVTRVLKQLEEELVASGYLGGKLGEFIESELDQAEISHSFYKIAGDTRNCIAILHDGKQTEILEKGPRIEVDEAHGFLKHFESLLGDLDIVSISGSVPKGLANNFYAQMIVKCQEHGVPVVLDCSGQALLSVLEGNSQPTVIKPNLEELSQLLGREVTGDIPSLKRALESPLFDKIEWVIVSLGSKGAFAKHRNLFYKVEIPAIRVLNPVGSGDSTVAGIASALLHQESDIDLLKKANVLGMLNAQESLTGHVNLDHYDSLWKQIEVTEV